MQGTDRFIIEWLARAADDPGQAHQEWDRQGVALLRSGRSFSVVRIPANLVHAALGAEFTAAELASQLDGAVIHDGPESPYWVLIRNHAGLVWDEGDDVPSLGTNHYLGVPSVARRTPPGLHWAVAPRFDGDVCRPSTLRTFIARARQQLAVTSAEA
ncbi:hypothetical protein [Streptomyces rubradiris]|uniref:Uncharacterized protein n=1 Tax=Streptomyces rubradiris TaxID=285531 RepID=A0ABQ3R3L0_STRRR|nr:hypothetical protein [Streptomyces rubradiris]GHH30325.1 hypothetical protein GCM10018792_76690 [Streptomyces rubradiris]GHI50450.1 hypothetical protein Srubr_02960 [Streptomyces rubradiris]